MKHTKEYLIARITTLKFRNKNNGRIIQKLERELNKLN